MNFVSCNPMIFLENLASKISGEKLCNRFHILKILCYNESMTKCKFRAECERLILRDEFLDLHCNHPCVLTGYHRYCRCAKHQRETERKRNKPVKPGWKPKKQKSSTILNLEEKKKDLESKLDILNKIIKVQTWFEKYSKKGSK